MRWIKPAPGCYAPRCIISVIVQRDYLTESSDRGLVHTRFGHAVAVRSTRRKSEWVTETPLIFESGDDLHDWIETTSTTRRRTYVVAPIASDALTLTGFWARITRRGSVYRTGGQRSDIAGNVLERTAPYTFTRLVTSGKPDIVQYTHDKRSIIWLSGHQYFGVTEWEIGDTISFGWPLSGGHPGPNSTVAANPTDRALLWSMVMRRLADWWLEIDGGPWGVTAGQLSMSYFRHRLTPKTCLDHSDKWVKGIENQAIIGARASVWYVGNIGHTSECGERDSIPPPMAHYPWEYGPLTQVDVRSQHPYLMSCKQFPVRLVAARANPSVADLIDAMQTYGVIAQVELSTPKAEYPHRANDRITYPTGTFTTTLCTPELTLALAEGAVQTVGMMSLYQMGTPFKRTATEMLALKAETELTPGLSWKAFAKLLAVGLAGKLAQRGGQWVADPKACPECEWGEWRIVDGRTGRIDRYRARAGMVWRYVPDATIGRPMGAAFAFLTSYGRAMMRSIRELCPWHTIVAQDTDGIWVTPDGLRALKLKQSLWGQEPGNIRVTSTVTHARFWDAKHYWTNKGWTLSGIALPQRYSDGKTFKDRYETNPIRGVPTAPPSILTERYVTKVLDIVPIDGTIGPSGWIDPLFHKIGKV